MKRAFAKTACLAIGLLAVASQGAQAKDWIEQVRLTNGIDTTTISVRSDGMKYTTTTQRSHRFKLELYAKAKSGKQIMAARVTAGSVGNYLESNGNLWSYELPFHLMAGGTKRTWSRQISPRVNLAQLVWNGPNPAQACNNLLKGKSRAAVLGSVQNTTAKAVFHLRALAAKPKFAQSGTAPTFRNKNKWTEESRGLQYTVRVRCLPSGSPGNQLQSG